MTCNWFSFVLFVFPTQSLVKVLWDYNRILFPVSEEWFINIDQHKGAVIKADRA